MKAQRWKEIYAIFAAALECETDARTAYLDEACAGDEQLRAEVESLLANDVPESLVEGQAAQHATRLLELRVGEPTVVRVGRYRITGILGAGGMGRVYLGLDGVRVISCDLVDRPTTTKSTVMALSPEFSGVIANYLRFFLGPTALFQVLRRCALRS